MQEILQSFQENTITELEFIAHQDFQIFEFKIKGVIQKTFSVPLPTEWIDDKPSDYIVYIDKKPYSKYPIFSEKSFNALKDALLLNTSLIMWSTNSVILNKEQCDYLDRIMQRNIGLSRMTNNMTLFHYSAIHGDIDVVQMYSWAAKEVTELEVKCQNGKTPLAYALENNQLVIVSFLKNQIQELCPQKIASEKASSHTQMDKPLSDATKQHIFDSLRRFARLKPDVFNQNLVAAALTNMVFPSAVKEKLKPLQLAYQSNKASKAIELLLAEAIRTYFKEEGVTLFTELLNDAFIPDDWNHDLLKKLSGCEIIIIENPYIEATIQDGKVYWCINFGNQVYYRGPLHEPIISQAITQNRSWRLTWKEFRCFKDAGKRIGTVSITEERFVNTIRPFLNNDTWAISIWQELRTMRILDKKLRLSQAWYPFSNKDIILNTIGKINNKKKVVNLYQVISDTLQQIANNELYQETIAQNMIIYRPARVSKIWSKTGLIKNSKVSPHATKIWDVGVSRELIAHAVPVKNSPCIADHIPSQSQVKTMCEAQINQCEQEINAYITRNPHALRCIPQDLSYLYERRQYWIYQLQAFKMDGGGLALWSIYITKELDNTGDTTRTCKKDQENLSFYSSVKKHIDDLKKNLKEGTITLTQLLQALGAFRYMYSRMCKSISNINGQDFIHNISYRFFGLPDKSNDRRQMDEFFIQEIQLFQN